jgi:tRNA pseudouridine38-40 synthase
MKIVVAYFGRPFHGWQRQPGQKTVQGELEGAVSTLIDGHVTTVSGAGRTDAGVHAAGQVAHVDLPAAIPPDGLTRGLNAILPPEIRVLSARPVSADFHARKSARGKLYVYRCAWQAPALPWSDPLAAVLKPIEDLSSLTDAIVLLTGRHDWASFTVPNPESVSTVRTLFQLRMRPRRNGVEFAFLGEGFLRYQVRRMVGALLEIGWGRRTMDQLHELLSDPIPGAPLQTAPAAGLTLERVYYRTTPAIRNSAAGPWPEGDKTRCGRLSNPGER